MKTMILGLVGGLLLGSVGGGFAANLKNEIEEHRHADFVARAQSQARLKGLLEAEARAEACRKRLGQPLVGNEMPLGSLDPQDY